MSDPKPPAPFVPPRQLTIALDPVRLRGMSAAERRSVVTALATLLTEAAGLGAGGRYDDGR